MADNDPLILDFRNSGLPEGADLDEYYVSGLDDDESADWDDIDLEDAFDLPPVLPPVRLPEEAELAAQARRSALLADLCALADEVRKTTVQTAAVNPVLLRLAEEAELVERDGEDLAPGEDAEWLDDLADHSDALDAWEYAFAVVLDTTLEAADDSDPLVADDLDLEGHGPALVMSLFLSPRDGVRITELAGAIKDAATADLEAEEAGRQWQEWVDAHGDPLRLLLGQLERLGAVSVTDDAARLEPLGVRAVRSKLERDDLFVPVLPAPDKMTPDDLVLVFMHGSDDDLEAELASWTDSRGEEVARAQQREGVLKALLEDLIGELLVGQGAGELQCPYHQGEDAERLRTCRGRIVGRQAGGDVVDDSQHAVGVGPLGCVRAAPDLVEQGGGGAAVAGIVAVLDRKVFTHVLLDSGAAGHPLAEARALFAELVGDRGGWARMWSRTRVMMSPRWCRSSSVRGSSSRRVTWMWPGMTRPMRARPLSVMVTRVARSSSGLGPRVMRPASSSRPAW